MRNTNPETIRIIQQFFLQVTFFCPRFNEKKEKNREGCHVHNMLAQLI